MHSIYDKTLMSYSSFNWSVTVCSMALQTSNKRCLISSNIQPPYSPNLQLSGLHSLGHKPIACALVACSLLTSLSMTRVLLYSPGFTVQFTSIFDVLFARGIAVNDLMYHENSCLRSFTNFMLFTMVKKISKLVKIQPSYHQISQPSFFKTLYTHIFYAL